MTDDDVAALRQALSKQISGVSARNVSNVEVTLIDAKRRRALLASEAAVTFDIQVKVGGSSGSG